MRHLFSLLALAALLAALLFDGAYGVGGAAHAAPAKTSKELKQAAKTGKSTAKRLRAAGKAAAKRLKLLTKAVKKGRSLDGLVGPQAKGKATITFTLDEYDQVVSTHIEIRDDLADEENRIFAEATAELESLLFASGDEPISAEQLEVVHGFVNDVCVAREANWDRFAKGTARLTDTVSDSSGGEYRLWACAGDGAPPAMPAPGVATSTLPLFGASAGVPILLSSGTSTGDVHVLVDPASSFAFATSTPPVWQLTQTVATSTVVLSELVGSPEENVVTFPGVQPGSYTVRLGVATSTAPVFLTAADVCVPAATPPDGPGGSECATSTQGVVSLRGDLTIDQAWSEPELESAFLLLENDLLSQLQVVFTNANGERLAVIFLPTQLSEFRDTYTIGSANAGEIALVYQERNTEVLVSYVQGAVIPDFTVELCLPKPGKPPRVGQGGVSFRIHGAFGWVDRFDSGDGTVNVQTGQVEVLDEFPF